MKKEIKINKLLKNPLKKNIGVNISLPEIKLRKFVSSSTLITERLEHHSIGSLIVDNKIKIQKLKMKTRKTFGKITSKLTKEEEKSRNLLEDSINKKYDKKFILPSKIEEQFLIEDYNKKWNYKLNMKKKLNENIRLRKFEKISNKSLNSYSLVDSGNTKLNGLTEIINDLELPKKPIKAEKIVKLSEINLSKKSPLKIYLSKLKTNLQKYLDFKRNPIDYYKFNYLIKKHIKENKIGLEFPGTFLNRDNKKNHSYIEPSGIKIRKLKYVSVPELTMIPIPSEINFEKHSRVLMRDIYNDKNLYL